jgi:hypothetical protein
MPRPKSGPAGNQDNDKRGRDIPTGGRTSGSKPSGSGGGDSQTERHTGESDTDGYGVGKR